MSTEVPEYERDDAAIRDGIDEEDNKIPLWFNLGFYGMIVVGIVYLVYYTQSGWSSAGQYEAEVAVAEALAEEVRASLPTTNVFAGNSEAIAQGQEVYTTTCAVCHKPDGSGMVGPSLVDPYWKYGDSDEAKFASVAEGRPLGMPPWLAVLGNEKIWKALAYVDSLPRSDAPGVGSPDYQPPQP
ncbi:MAG: c-type cytochrome [Myxococcota bacterium]|nr:c-type cytochrome [Myxococcota bacterium]